MTLFSHFGNTTGSEYPFIFISKASVILAFNFWQCAHKTQFQDKVVTIKLKLNGA